MPKNFSFENIDIEKWERARHFSFFQERRDPRISITAKVSVAELLNFRLEKGEVRPSLSTCIYYSIMRAVNAIPEFKMRIIDLRPVVFGRVDAAFTHSIPGKSLHCNCIAKYSDEFSSFNENVEKAKSSCIYDYTLTPCGGDSQGLIYISGVRMVDFYSVGNPWGDPWHDTVPRVIFGKISKDNHTMSVAVEALHSFIDGVHLGKFYDAMSEILTSPHRYFL